jgi:diguanylate cyclase (GGDEF)-like protein
MWLSWLRLGVFGKFAVVSFLLLFAVASLGWLTVLTTRAATTGADMINREFAERVRTDDAVVLLIENAALAAERLQATKPAHISKIESELAATGEALARAIAPILAGDEENDPTEEGVLGEIRTTYPAYVSVRDRLLRQAATLSAAGRVSARVRLGRAAGPARADLAAYAEAHFEEGNEALDDLRRTGADRNVWVVALLGFALMSLLATLLVARRIVKRLREYATFATVVANGNLDARLEPQGQDELGALTRGLNSMVEQLAASSSERHASQETESAYRASQDTFSEVLQVAESEREAHDILKLHLERSVPGSEVVVLNRNNSEDRLEATVPLSADSRLRQPLQTAQPRSCLAVRLARPYESAADAPTLLECEICGTDDTDSTCLPLLVSGQVIGSVLLDHTGRLGKDDERRLHESVAQAAPILANLRNLGLAEARAATDALTGLPNRRAVQDTLKRMLAQSARTISPMAVVLIDLDNFKRINDTFGHEEGDAVLAAVGDTLSNTVRTSDFVGRNGGEEFIALLPDTNAQDALRVAEKLRVAIESIRLARVEHAITASFGVAVHPDMAGESDTLMRLADRALYAAKAAGRNRVELAGLVAAAPGEPAGAATAATSA